MTDNQILPIQSEVAVEPPYLRDVKNTRHVLGNIGHTYVYELMNSGELEWVLVGKRRMIIDASIKAYIERLKEAKPKS